MTNVHACTGTQTFNHTLTLKQLVKLLVTESFSQLLISETKWSTCTDTFVEDVAQVVYNWCASFQVSGEGIG